MVFDKLESGGRRQSSAAAFSSPSSSLSAVLNRDYLLPQLHHIYSPRSACKHCCDTAPSLGPSPWRTPPSSPPCAWRCRDCAPAPPGCLAAAAPRCLSLSPRSFAPFQTSFLSIALSTALSTRARERAVVSRVYGDQAQLRFKATPNCQSALPPDAKSVTPRVKDKKPELYLHTCSISTTLTDDMRDFDVLLSLFSQIARAQF